METRLHPALAGVFFCSEDIFSPGFHQQCFEPSTKFGPTVSVIAAYVNNVSLEAHANSVHLDGVASPCFGGTGC